MLLKEKTTKDIKSDEKSSTKIDAIVDYRYEFNNVKDSDIARPDTSDCITANK